MKASPVQPRILLFMLAAVVTLGLANWMIEPGQAQSNSQNPQTKEAELIGQAEEEDSFDLILSLKLQNQEELDQLIAEQHDSNSPSYQKWLTPEQFGERFGPSREDYERVENWLKEQGFEISMRWPSRAQINFRATARQIKQAFRTSIKHYKKSGELFFANDTNPVLPSDILPMVNYISGLENFTKLRPAHRIKPQFRDRGRLGIAPKDMHRVYNLESLISSGLDGQGQKIGIVARSNFKVRDVQLFRTNFGLPPNKPKKILPYGSVRNLGGGEEIEVLLDAEWAGALAPAATVIVVVAPEVDLSLQHFVNNMPEVKSISMSFGLCEQKLGERRAQMFHDLYTQAAAQGQTVFVSSGDDGANDCGDGRGQQVNGLASSPNCVAVGGITLDANFDQQGEATSLGSEIVWDGSGGGSSDFFKRPSYQQNLEGLVGQGSRSVPDVAQIADPSGPGAWFARRDQTSCCIGGTSLAAPIWASFLALVNQKAGPQGNFNFKLYSMGAAQSSNNAPSVFNDTVRGINTSNGVTGFQAVPGYDQATGWGSFNGQVFIDNIK